MVDVIEAAKSWIAHDPDARDRAELAALVMRAEVGDDAAPEELASRMAGPLVFGTAGLRGAVGAGSARMNTAVVTTATAGLCAVLREQLGTDPHVVIGYDARHRSAEFARTVAGVVVACGGRGSLMPDMCPTPLVAFAVNHLDADAAVMITASHNPAADNGYKVYLGARMTDEFGRGAQLVSPTDELVMAAITSAGAADGVPVADRGWQVVPPEVEDAYVEATRTLVTRLQVLTGVQGDLADLRVVLTTLHGVGARLASRVLRHNGLDELHLVVSQCTPDPDFPTVPFPNPEELGAIDLAVALGLEVAADVVVALDPDADRCSIAVPAPGVEGGWRQLTGDELGALLGDHIGSAYAGSPDAVLARSIVSSSLLDRIAAGHGIVAAQTLTGFKWIARVPGIVYGFEEAIGYCVNPMIVRDKDGITAALIACRLAAIAKRDGRTLLEALDDLALGHGLVLTAPMTFRVGAPALITAALARLVAQPPTMLGGSRVIEVIDLADGYLGLAPTVGFRLETARGDRVVIRPSGTEPKLKCYLEVVDTVPGREELATVRLMAAARLEQIKGEVAEALGL